MRRRLIWFGFVMLAAGVTAQTVTGSGNGNTVPVFTGSSTIGNSPISISGSNVGIGTMSPSQRLEVNGWAQIDGSMVLSGGGVQASGALSSQNSGTDTQIFLWADSNIAYMEAHNFTNSVKLPIAINAWGGNVGIGTTTPVGQLSNNAVNFGDLGSGVSTGSFNWLHNSADGGWNTISSAGYDGLVVATDQTNGTPFQVSTGIYNPNTGQRPNHLFTVLGSGNVGIGTTNPAAKLEINGGLRFSGDAGGVVQTTAWTGILCGGDYAESVDVNGDPNKYGPGDVLVIDPKNEGTFLRSSEPYSTFVTGIYSTKPGILGRRQRDPKSPDEVPMAMTGIVPAKVSAENGAIHPGDLLVTSSTLGFAMKGTDRSRMLGAVIGKALGTLESGSGVVEVVVTLQ